MKKCVVNVHAKSRLILEPLRTLRSEDKGQAGACPDRTRAIPCKVRRRVTMIRKIRGMILVSLSDRAIESKQARVAQFARLERRPPEP